MGKIGKIICLCALTVWCTLILMSCGDDKSGCEAFKKNMLSDFTVEVEYLIDMNGNPLTGSAVITKDDNLRLDIASPEPFSGISVSCDAEGNPDVISLTYSGIKAEVPRAAMEKFVFLMNAMSESTACALDSQKKKSFLPNEILADSSSGILPYSVSFTHENAEYSFTYDSLTSLPLEIRAENENCKCEIKIIEFKAETE